MNGNAKEFAEELKRLAERLETCDQVRRYDRGDEKQAWTLAHAFMDLAQSFRFFLDDQLPRLRAEEMGTDQLYDVLLEIGEEFRHILYHIRDAQFYSYLRSEEIELLPPT